MIWAGAFSHFGSSPRAGAAPYTVPSRHIKVLWPFLFRPHSAASTQALGRAVIVWASCHSRLSTPAPQAGGRNVHKCPEGSLVNPTTLVSSIASRHGLHPRRGILHVSGKFHGRIRALDSLPRCRAGQGPGIRQTLDTVSAHLASPVSSDII